MMSSPLRHDPRPLHWMALAHHPLQQANRCVHLPLGQRRLALCARCLGLYPALAATLVLQILWRPGSLGAVDWWLVLAGSAPALLDWGAGLLDWRSGSNPRRLVSGALLGAALGRSFWLYFGDPLLELLLCQALLLVFGALAFLVVRRLRPDSKKPL